MIRYITESMDMNLSKLQEIVKNREAWLLQFMGSQRVRHNLAIERQQGTRSQMPQLKVPCATAKT